MKALSKLATAAGLALASGMSHAVLITDWSYVNHAGFDDGDWTPASAVTATDIDGTTGYYKNLAWGTPVSGDDADPNSSFVVTSPAAGAVSTNGAAVAGTVLTHNNFPIVGEALETALLTSMLTLTPTAPIAGPPLPAPTLFFDIHFFETPNAGLEGDPTMCPDGTANFAGPNVAGCGDIFAIEDELSLASAFVLGDYEYTVSISIDGGGILSDTACSAVGFGSGCYGFITEENAVNTVNPEFAISSRFIGVPEPSSIAVLGLAMGLLAFRNRKS